MIKNNDENANKGHVFKNFSDIAKTKNKPKDSTEDHNVEPTFKLPMNPNLPMDTPMPETIVDKTDIPVNAQPVNPTKAVSNSEQQETNEKVQLNGKIAKFPKNTKASNAYTFLEKIKVNKSNLWYILVEKQDNELQMVKYNAQVGVNLNEFVNELKSYYIKKYSSNPKITEIVEKINVDGCDKFSIIKNIPKVKIGGVSLISMITQDLIKLLSK